MQYRQHHPEESNRVDEVVMTTELMVVKAASSSPRHGVIFSK
jgi:hypothetical protein